MNAGQAKALVTILAAKYPSVNLSQGNIDAYANTLMDFDYDTMHGIVEGVCRESNFFPSLAELCHAAAERQLQLPSVTDAEYQLTHFYEKDQFHPLVWQAHETVGRVFDWRMSETPSILIGRAVKAYTHLRAETVKQAVTNPDRTPPTLPTPEPLRALPSA